MPGGGGGGKSSSSPGGGGGGGGGGEDSLGATLVQECVWHMLESTRAGDSSVREMLDSLHPLPARCDYKSQLTVRGAKAVMVSFDHRSRMPPGSAVSFYSDAERQRLVRRIEGSADGNPRAFTPFVVHAETVFVRVTSMSGSALGAENRWGFKVVASPMQGLQWMREEQVTSQPSLEWACWVLAFLLLEADGLVREGAVHNLQVFMALFSYLRSRGTPYKHRVVQLLTHLLRHPDRFPVEERPDLTPMTHLEAAVMRRVGELRASQTLFLPPRLLQLVELLVVSRRASRHFVGGSAAVPLRPQPLRFRRSTALFNRAVVLEPRLQLGVGPELRGMSESEVLLDVMDMAESLVARARMPDHVICDAFLMATGAARGSKLKRDRVERALREMGPWTYVMDSQLVMLANDIAQYANRKTLELRPRDVALSDRHRFKYQQLTQFAPAALQLRYALLHLFNERLARVVDLIDLTSAHPHPESLSARMRLLSHCVFRDTKLDLLRRALVATRQPGTCGAAIMLDNRRAWESLERNVTSATRSQCIFAQAFRALRNVPAAQFRCALDEKERLFQVKFRGEDGIDWGGLYRECLHRMAEDLFSDKLDLFVLCPNGREANGVNTEKYMPNPRHTSPFALEMFEFVGRLIGISLRQDAYLPFEIVPAIWRHMVGHPHPWADLREYDKTADSALRAIAEHADAESFEDAYDLHFVAHGSDQRVVELVPGGANIPVTFENRLRYCSLVRKMRAKECTAATEAIRRGLVAIVPERALQLFTAPELELLVCGDPTVDVALLKQHTTYHGYNRDDSVCRRFWEVLAQFTDEERSKFIRFAWGRSRLPAPRDWDRPFKLTRKNGSDNQLPLAHTCFFQIELPPYSSKEIMRKRLLTAIHYGLGEFMMA
mmetsp:Transcript_16694/g.53294  ORF Transcript_16694/g.53294 Transcript_16694/m.53294 type:complete len:892 (+) Transcript_16694:267-2942(+)